MLEILNDIRALGWDEIFLSAGIGFILITLNRPKKKAATTEKHSIFLDRSRFFAYEEIRSSMLKFEWIPIRKYLIEDKIREQKVRFVFWRAKQAPGKRNYCMNLPGYRKKTQLILLIGLSVIWKQKMSLMTLDSCQQL
ncbi:hypothetical protein B6I21_08165 [candidate division KSB1 bacterium 4572_119]|nr:MAG: hypothetical protein B6I21_08165 [candidate division KSB1 bacterium 4572_119]